jgi:hypothetical protein
LIQPLANSREGAALVSISQETLVYGGLLPVLIRMVSRKSVYAGSQQAGGTYVPEKRAALPQKNVFSRLKSSAAIVRIM